MDEETELMMDDLLMAPPMSLATLRGLLPRFVNNRKVLIFEFSHGIQIIFLN